MTTSTKTHRYRLPKKTIKGDCPQCRPKHRKTLSRYVDTQTNEPLPEEYGRCDRESNCGYHLSPYRKGITGLSYCEEQNALAGVGLIPKEWFRIAGKQKRNGVSRSGLAQTLVQMEGATAEQAERVAAYIFDKPVSTQPELPICVIPNEVFEASLGHYERNQFAQLLNHHLGVEPAKSLLNRFQVGTSSYWTGACVFWYIDELGRKRGGQIKLFNEDFHTVKYQDSEGQMRSKTSWVHSALIRRYTQRQQPIPNWLSEYDKQADRSPCLFGLPQLMKAPIDQSIAIVEAPKTAILCSHYFPKLVWMAVGGKSYLNIERLAAVRHRRIILYPDLNAYHDTTNTKGHKVKGWLTVAEDLRAEGFTIEVSAFLEKNATDEQKQAGLDLADFLLNTTIQKRIEDVVQTNKVNLKSRSIEARQNDPAPTIEETFPSVIEKVEQPGPAESKSIPFRLPPLIETYWLSFIRPPFWYNKIRVYKALLRYLNPDLPREVVTTINEQYNSPGSILRPAEAQLEREPEIICNDYPAELDCPGDPDATPRIKPLTFFEWQRLDPHFSQLGLVSLHKPSDIPWRNND